MATIDDTLAELTAQVTDLQRRITEASEDLAAAQAREGTLTAANAEQAGIISTLRAELADVQHQLDVALHPVDNLLTLDLQSIPLGKVGAVSAGKMWGLPGKLAADANWARTYNVEDSPGGDRWLRQKFAAGPAGQGSGNGISLGVPFPGGERVEKATIAMGVRTSPGFDATYGVKGPGLVGLTPDQPSLTFPSGDKPDPLGQGMSGRWMLFNQRSLSGHVFVHPNEWAWYTYHNTLREQYIWAVPPVPFEPGRAYDLVETIELNDPALLPAADGVARAWIDDQLVVDRDDYDWRRRPDLDMVGVMWSIFRGGPAGDARYEQPTESWIDIADGLTVTTPRAA